MNPLYADVNLHGDIVSGLRRRGIDVLTAQEDNADGMPDTAILERATALGRVLVTYDKDFLAIGATFQSQGIPFSGIVWIPPRTALQICIDDLELLALAELPERLANQICYIPLPE